MDQQPHDHVPDDDAQDVETDSLTAGQRVRQWVDRLTLPTSLAVVCAVLPLSGGTEINGIDLSAMVLGGLGVLFGLAGIIAAARTKRPLGAGVGLLCALVCGVHLIFSGVFWEQMVDHEAAARAELVDRGISPLTTNVREGGVVDFTGVRDGQFCVGSLSRSRTSSFEAVSCTDEFPLTVLQERCDGGVLDHCVRAAERLAGDLRRHADALPYAQRACDGDQAAGCLWLATAASRVTPPDEALVRRAYARACELGERSACAEAP